MKISVEANGNKFEFRMTRPDKVATDALCRIIRAQAPDKTVAKKGTAKKATPKRRAKKYTHWDIHLAVLGPSKINVIKAIRTLTGLGLKEHQVQVWRDALEKECGATLRLAGVG